MAAFALGVFGALIYAYITVSLRANQVVTGLALTIFGSGLANFFGQLMIANYKTAHGGAIPNFSLSFGNYRGFVQILYETHAPGT